MIPLPSLLALSGAAQPAQADQPLGAERTSASDPLREVAQKFEAAFLAEMLRHTGVGKMQDGFNGGPGEAAFSNFLTQEYAAKISQAGSFHLADKLYESLLARSGS